MAAPAAGCQSFPAPFAVADRARFFKSWLRRIAPDAPQEIPLGDTHQDQAGGDETACRPGGFAAPEERWCQSIISGIMSRGDSGKLAAFLAFISAINQCRTGNAFAQCAPDIGNWPHRLRVDGLRGFYFDHAYVLPVLAENEHDAVNAKKRLIFNVEQKAYAVVTTRQPGFRMRRTRCHR